MTYHLPTENRKQQRAPNEGIVSVYKETPKIGYFYLLPLTSTHSVGMNQPKQASEGPISLELMGLCLRPTERLKNSPAHVVFYTLGMSHKVSLIRVEVKVRIVGKGSNNAHNK